MYAPAAAKLARSGVEPRAIHGNCSGKHAGMLALCVHEVWPTAGYRRLDHPLQVVVLETLARVCGLERDEVLIAGDDCGVPTFRPSAQEPGDRICPARDRRGAAG